MKIYDSAPCTWPSCEHTSRLQCMVGHGQGNPPGYLDLRNAALLNQPPSLTRNPCQHWIDPVVQAARVIIHDYDQHHFMQTADYHDDDCICLRCAVDRLRDLFGEADK